MRVLVIGEALIDIVRSDGGMDEHVGGSPANVALGLGRRGVPVGLLTQLADDARGRRVIAHLEASGVHVLAESLSAPRTSTAEARIGPDGQAEYTFDLAWGPIPTPVGVAPTVVHTGSVAAFLEPGADTVRGILHSTSAKEITFDPNIRPALLGTPGDAFAAFVETARLSTVVKMSDEDAAWLYPDLTADAVLQEVLELGPQLAAITLGSEGAILANADHRVWIPAVSVDAVDTIGAGDTFMGSLIHAVFDVGSEGLDRSALEQIGSDAVRAASITVSRAGADLPWARDL